MFHVPGNGTKMLLLKLIGGIKGTPKGTTARSKGNNGGLAHCHLN